MKLIEFFVTVWPALSFPWTEAICWNITHKLTWGDTHTVITTKENTGTQKNIMSVSQLQELGRNFADPQKYMKALSSTESNKVLLRSTSRGEIQLGSQFSTPHSKIIYWEIRLTKMLTTFEILYSRSESMNTAHTDTPIQSPDTAIRSADWRKIFEFHYQVGSGKTVKVPARVRLWHEHVLTPLSQSQLFLKEKLA